MKILALIYQTGIGIGMPVLLGLTIRAAKKKKPAPKIPHGPMFHDDSNSDQVEKNKNDISGNKPHFNPETQESAKKRSPKIPQGPIFHDDSNSDQVEENEISGNKPHFNPQTQESAKKKSPKIPKGPMFQDDSNLDHEENKNAIYVISRNDHHPFSPQILESHL